MLSQCKDSNYFSKQRKITRKKTIKLSSKAKCQLLATSWTVLHKTNIQIVISIVKHHYKTREYQFDSNS